MSNFIIDVLCTIKWDKLSFSSIKIYESFPTSLRWMFNLLSQLASPIIFRVEISITILDTNITDDIWKIINVK